MLFKGIGCLVVIFFFFFVGLFKVLRNIYKALTGEDPTERKRKYNNPYRTEQPKSNVHSSKTEKKKKDISDDEGEYVDYEDVDKK